MPPAALAKAESLHKFAASQGCPLNTFALVLTDDEGLELVDWLLEQNSPNDVLELDVAEAHRTHDPWGVLDHFVLLGLPMARASLVLN